MANPEKVNVVVTEVDEELTEEQIHEQVRRDEPDLLSRLKQAGAYRDDPNSWKEVPVIREDRDGKPSVLFSFHVRPLSREETERCRKDHTVMKKNRQTGLMTRDSFDQAGYEFDLIYRATTDEDRKKIWDEQKLWQYYNVLSGPMLVSVMLTAGDVSRAIVAINDASGYDLEVSETVKN